MCPAKHTHTLYPTPTSPLSLRLMLPQEAFPECPTLQVYKSNPSALPAPSECPFRTAAMVIIPGRLVLPKQQGGPRPSTHHSWTAPLQVSQTFGGKDGRWAGVHTERYEEKSVLLETGIKRKLCYRKSLHTGDDHCFTHACCPLPFFLVTPCTELDFTEDNPPLTRGQKPQAPTGTSSFLRVPST